MICWQSAREKKDILYYKYLLRTPNSKNMNIYRYISYQEIIKKEILERKKVNSKVTFSRLADLMNVQKAYVSKVMRSEAHFSSDQLYLACTFLSLTPDETSYMLLLLEHERTVVQERKAQLLKQIRQIQAEHRKPSKNLKDAKVIDAETKSRFAEYYFNPYTLIIHICLSIPNYQTKPKLLLHKLRIQESQLNHSLDLLERLELIRWSPHESRYLLLENYMQLSEDSPIRQPYLALFRAMSTDQVLRIPGPERFGFSVTISADEKSRNQMQEEFMTFIKRAQAIVSEAQPERVYQINFDLFPWDND